MQAMLFCSSCCRAPGILARIEAVAAPGAPHEYLSAGRSGLPSVTQRGRRYGARARGSCKAEPWPVPLDGSSRSASTGPGCRHGPDVYLETLKRWGADGLPRSADCAHTAACSGRTRPRNPTTRQSETCRLNAARMHPTVRTNRSANQIIRSHVGAHTSPLIFFAGVPSPDDRVLCYSQTRRAAAERPCRGVNLDDDGHRSPAALG